MISTSILKRIVRSKVLPGCCLVAGIRPMFYMESDKEFFTFDTSLVAWWLPRQNYYYNDIEEYSSYFSLNPKHGLKLRRFWFKIGPLFVFGENFNAYFDNYT